jgi:hypothetical protein
LPHLPRSTATAKPSEAQVTDSRQSLPLSTVSGSCSCCKETDETSRPVFPPPRPLPEEWKDIVKWHERFNPKHQIDWVDVFDRLPLFKQQIAILIVVDTGIGFSNDPNAGFNLGMVIDAIREDFSPCLAFSVSLAVRGSGTFGEITNPGPYQARYTNFRFDARDSAGVPIIHRYSQIWCFGLAPGNGAFTDTEVTTHPLRTTDSELAVVSRWMDERDGGVFATGDHAHLGAVMAGRIPRVGTMRKWIIADDPPTFVGEDRYDTNQPATSTATEIPSVNQGDAVPQPVDLVPERILFSPLVFKTRFEPHPVMCGGNLGAIDIFPDHQHEGQVVEDGAVATTRTVTFSGADGNGNLNSYSAPEYPQTGATQTRPRIVARATPKSSSNYSYPDKGPHHTPQFGMVGVYDGHKEGVGRVVVDSTWHHWLNVNLKGFAADMSSTNYAKIKTYFRNVGLWLAGRSTHRKLYATAVWNAQLTYDATQELAGARKWWQEGLAMESIIHKFFSPCIVTEWHIAMFPPEIVLEVWPRFPIPEPCLSCPPIDFMKWSILTEVSRALRKPREVALAQLRSTKDGSIKANEKEILANVDTGIDAGLKLMQETMLNSLERGRNRLDLLNKRARVGDTVGTK